MTQTISFRQAVTIFPEVAVAADFADAVEAGYVCAELSYMDGYADAMQGTVNAGRGLCDPDYWEGLDKFHADQRRKIELGWITVNEAERDASWQQRNGWQL